jgi:hypothetical protein
MTTYREAIYMCNDLLKGMSDDFTYTEEHIAYLLDKFRALLLKQRYGSDPKKHVPYSNYQTLEITLEDTEGGEYFKSTEAIPYTLQLGIPRITVDNYYDITVELVSRERLPFVGNNKYLRKISYAAIDHNNSLLLKKNHCCCCCDYDTKLKLTAIFENPREVTDEISFGESSTDTHEWDRNIPIEESLITSLIELVVKELASSVYRPNDDINDNRDDNADMATFIKSNMKSNLAKQLA